MFKFRSGTHKLNEELGRNRGREGKMEYSLCGDERENVSHMFWDCSTYSSTRASFMKKLQELLEDDCELWERVRSIDCFAWLRNIHALYIDVWEIRKHEL